MPSVTVIFPDQLLARVDELVARRKAARGRELTPAELQAAHEIAAKDGCDAANRYLESLGVGGGRVSRMSVVLELVEGGLAAATDTRGT